MASPRGVGEPVSHQGGTDELEDVECRVGPLYATIAQEWQVGVESLTEDDLQVCVDFVAGSVEINRRPVAISSDGT
jgi:hypothetical protein